MVRGLLATLAAALLVGVLALLIVESRAVKEDYYVAHAERLRAIETSRDDINAILQGSQSAFDEGRAIPASIELAFGRLAENSTLLQNPVTSSAADPVVQQQLAAYDNELKQFVNTGAAFSVQQNSLAESLRVLQETSPDVVKELRRFNLRIESQNAFSLAIEIIEFAMGQNQADPAQLAARIDALRNDSNIASTAPGVVDRFTDAASSVIEEHTAAEAAVGEIAGSRVADELWALSSAIVADNRRVVSRAERARLLLAACAVLLLVGAGFAMIRLQSSYRALNKSNSELADVNNSLEQRVSSRTEELSGAYDELKESQVQLVQAEKMSSLGQLVAGISHEINTPLWYLTSNSTVVQERLQDFERFIGIAERMIAAARSKTAVRETVGAGLIEMSNMLQEGLKEDVDEAKDLMEDSVEGLEELTELAQSLKDFSRLDRAKHGQFNVNDGLDKTLLIVKNKIKNKATVHKHYDNVPSVFCSPSQINQVFLNLIVNAADAIETQGDINLRTWSESGRVFVRVSDTGCGIPADIMEKIRDPFFTTKEVGKGTGLGLSIVDRIVTAHNGKLEIESEPGKGTSITVVLPIEATEAAEAPEESETPSQDPITDIAGTGEVRMVTADGAGPTGTVVMNPDDTASALEEAAAQMPPPPTDGEWEGVDSGEFSVRIDVSKLIADHAKQQADENLPILDDEVDRGDKPPSP